ncbi:hypothetical protein K457DRAFT_141798 [Linnemannia elongata AG-77]|uniref:Uncharacterized protein n=1 Tax=Linnemannia elongata AG-77 TaxID=1314771 RepID=A0A197JJS1_9FUNG|nr:hypothetical protein K457DRAFT_141798 [Linnemannia elongata AG-77]
MTTSITSRHRALLGVLLIFCIGSLLTLSLRPLSEQDSHSDWVVSRRPGFSSSTPSDSNSNNPSTSSSSSSSIDDPIGTGAKGSDPENHFGLDPYTIDYSKMTLRQLKGLIQSTLLDTSDDLLDPTRPIRPKGAPGTQSQLQVDELDSDDSDDDEENGGNNINSHDDDDEGGDEELDGGEADSHSSPEYDGEEEEDKSESSPPGIPAPAPEDEGVDESISSEEEEETEHPFDDSETEETQSQQDDEPLDEEQTYLDEPAGEQGELESENQPLEGEDDNNNNNNNKPSSVWDNTLQEFDVNKILPPSDSYLVFIPSGETIEAQFFSLLTSLWIAKHSNRTLIIPPPMMAPPSLYHLHPLFAGNKGRKRQRWSTLFDLRVISSLQRTVLIDTTRPVLQTPFTEEMAQEEENPTNATQSIPYRAPLTTEEDDDVTVTPAGSTVPVKIKCHGPPTAGSWKALDFAGRHFLNRYNLMAEFEILGDTYWSLKPEAISRHWRATTTSKTTKGGPGSEDRHRQFICISGAELVGSENAAIEEMIWQEIGLQIPFSNAVRTQGRQSVGQVLRAVERADRSNGYIGVHIDKLPSREFCRPGGPRHETSDSTSGSPQGQDQGSQQQQQQHQEEGQGAEGERKDEVNGNVVAAAAGNPAMTSTTSNSMIPSQCLWTVDLIAKRIALLQQTESTGVGTSRPPRPVIVTTTETDPELLSKMDQQTGWFRVGEEDEDNGLFDTTVEDLGGYGSAAIRTYVMSNSAVFVGNRASALATHAAFRIKNEGRVKQVPPRWELY